MDIVEFKDGNRVELRIGGTSVTPWAAPGAVSQMPGGISIRLSEQIIKKLNGAFGVQSDHGIPVIWFALPKAASSDVMRVKQ